LTGGALDAPGLLIAFRVLSDLLDRLGFCEIWLAISMGSMPRFFILFSYSNHEIG
jgi:hypothetical protein